MEKGPQIGTGGFFPTNPDLADFFCRTDLNFDNFYFVIVWTHSQGKSEDGALERKWKKKIKDQVKKNNLDSEIGDILWSVLEDSANYSFNKSHSISYAALSAITVYLKFKYPKEFFLSLLKMTRFEPDPIAEISKIQRELNQFGIKLLPPHLIKSDMMKQSIQMHQIQHHR